MNNSPLRVRKIQIALGALAILLAIIAITNPSLAVSSYVILIALVLITAGFENILTGLLIPHKFRLLTIGLGVLTIILAGLALAFPTAAARVVVLVLSLSLMLDGFTRIADGLTNKTDKKLVRALTIAVGVLGIIISVGVNIIPFWGKILISKLLAVDLIIIGIQMFTTGSINIEAGKREMKEKVKKFFQGRQQREENE
ncbi:MAG TPA: DUF308 domain-containing protein [Nitrososphaeraceae archaeon]|jgi:uncharacterized membrane protein HdeD (DUF308 family)